jgi:NADPH-dependent 2,4-dienoyl-CoA reductase/sulfur reductase-like enzyme
MPSRREIIKCAGGLTAAATCGLVFPAVAKAAPKVVVIGGGPGGATMVRRLAAKAGERLDITLVERNAIYTTCFYSNLYLAGFQSLGALQYDYALVAKLPGVTVTRDRATTIDRDQQEIRLEGGGTLAYDRLVVSPGIDLDYGSVPGWSKEAERIMPHAWQAGEQTELLKRQLDAVPDGGLIVVIPPPNPYRCPPGPYERVSMMAQALTSSGRSQTRIVIVDPKEKFSKQALFQQGWEQHYPGMIEWLPPFIHGGITSVDPATMAVATDFETLRDADLVNVIPAQTAGLIAKDAGLADDSGYCPIEPAGMTSTFDPKITVVGDAAIAGDMPKSAFAANSQAIVAADVLLTELLDMASDNIGYRNRCWSLITKNDSVFVGGVYQAGAEKIEQTESDISTLEDDPEQRRKNFEDSGAWYAGLVGDLYG